MKSRHILQRLLIITGVVVIIAVAALFISYRQITQDPERMLDLVEKQAEMHLDKIRQTATRNGVRDWYLEARSATLQDHLKQVQLDHPDVEIFMETGDTVHLTADQGIIYTDSNRITLSGQIIAKTDEYALNTEFLDYDPTEREIRTHTQITLTGTNMKLRADQMTANLNTRVACFEGHVEGTIHDGFKF
ncbi:LPS export ABC transporter periplasmic protein LptC [Desulfosarcina sp. OttesenSCG-928-A07]|nr:LPS export ABC transporter periplasmic protein LptC [Desulfosarcina sp. OttesenSCG-928-G17]MDL2329541.1 LPS export ABC transporter periplasmic protein LptC [Desulfosarcina sp. OttesenSCG-928-A07]